VDPKAQALYRKAAAAYAARRLDQCAKLLDELKATFPKSPLLTNARLKPSVAAMRKAIATQGDTLTVSRSGPHKSLADALGALKKPNSVVQIEPSRSPYRGGAVLSGDHAHGTVVRAAGDKNPCLDGGPAGKAIVQIFPDTRNVVIDGLTFQRTRSGVAIDERCSVAIRNCFGLKDVVAALTIAPESTVAISDSVLKINTLNAATAQDCAFLCGDTTIDYSRLTRCVLRGTDIGILGSTLTDCLIIGSVRIRDRATLNHVTITKTVTIERDIRGARLANCILPNLEFDKIDLKEWKRKTKEQKQDEALNVSLTNCLLFRHRDPLPDTIVKAQDTEPLARGNPGFRAPERGDFTLAEASPYRGKAADKSDLGCRLPPDTLKLLRYLAR